MVKLNLPPFEINVRKKQGRLEIFDVIRKKFIVLTPEEWVRQHMVHYLKNELNYPLPLIQVEGGLKYNRMQKRTDILVFNQLGVPAVLVECKSYKMKELGEKVFQQAAMYNHEMKAPYLVITNGWGFYCWSFGTDGMRQEKEIPAWNEINRQG